jgi:acyl-CoA synthetase (AMP-forming)/AMP-acid ligase II
MAVRIQLNSDGIREVLKSPEVAAELETRANRVAQAARAESSDEEYTASIAVTMEQHADRVVAHVGASALHAMVIEANTGNLAQSLDAAAG